MMPSQVSWYEPDQIILGEYSGHVTVDELQHSMHQIIDYLKNSAGQIHLIIDWQKVANTPNIMAVMSDASTVIQHERMGFVGVVGVNQVLAYWMQVFSKVAGLKSTRFDSVEDAAAFLKRL